MKKLFQLLLPLFLFFAGHLAIGQPLQNTPPKYCGTPEITKAYLDAHPDVKARMEAIEIQTRKYIQDAASVGQKEAPGTPVRPLITIPVVVHILFNTPAQNVDITVVQAQIDELNAGFRKLNPDVTQVPAAFAPFVADARINFCLATRDPNGGFTNGITRS